MELLDPASKKRKTSLPPYDRMGYAKKTFTQWVKKHSEVNQVCHKKHSHSSLKRAKRRGG